MDQDATWYGGRPCPRPHCVRLNPAPPQKRAQQPPPIFGPCLLWPNGWMDQDATWCRGRPRPRQHCVRWGPSSPSKGGTAPSPAFQPMSVAKRSPISATAEHLFLFGVEMSDLNAVIFTGQPAGLSDRLLVGSGHKNLDRFHICHYASPATHFF